MVGREQDAVSPRFQELDDDEIFEIIDQSQVLDGQTQLPGRSQAYKIVQPSQLDALNAVETDVDSTGSSSSLRPAQKLVELIDGDEAESEAADADVEEDGPEISDFGEEMFRLLLYMIVFGTLWLCMDMMIHAQYGQEVTFKGEIGRAVDVLPGLAFVVYLTTHYPSHILTKASLFCFSALGGSYMIYIVNRASYLQVMRRCPALGTLWLWAVVQLDLIAAVVSLLSVFAFVRYKGLNVIFAT